MIQGHFDCLAGKDVCGWAWDRGTPDRPVTVQVIIDGVRVAEALANQHRPDLQAAGIGSGHHAFFVPLPDTHLDGRTVELVIAGADGVPLAGTPAQVRLPQMVFQPVEPPAKPLPLTLAVCAIVKNEGPYLLEWIAHHRLVGVEHFVLFDNESSDETTAILAALARAGVVDHVPWPNIPEVAAQRPAYIAGLARLDGRCRWVAFIDADEFLTPLAGESIPDILKDYDKAAGLLVPWRLFGSNGHQDMGHDLVVRRFQRRAPAEHPLNSTVKTIVQARLVSRPDIHTPQIAKGSLIDEFGRIGGSQGHPDHHTVSEARRLVINHYFTKSRAEWDQKRSRGRATQKPNANTRVRPATFFETHDINEVEDRTLADRAAAIEAEMARLRGLMR